MEANEKHLDHASLSKADLQCLADRLLDAARDQEGIQECVNFFEGSSMGLWHGRARAMMARRLKHCELTQAQKRRVVECILARLVNGESSEQFRDQLRLGLHLDAARFYNAATGLLADPRVYLRKLAQWILEHDVVHTR